MRRPIPLLLAATTLTATLLAGCAGSAADTATQPTASDAGTADAAAPADSASADPASADGATRSIVDHAGNTVVLPATIERVAVDEIPIASTYAAYFDGAAPHLVGMSASVVTALEGTVAAEIAPELLEVDSGYLAGGELNIEALLALKPDVVLFNARNTEHAEMFAQAGIPAVGFATQGDPATVYVDWLHLLEDVFDEPGKMDEKIAAGQQLVDTVKERTAAVPQDQRPSALVIFNSDGKGTLRVAGGTPFFGSFWLDTAGARNVAQDAEGGLAPVSSEQVLAWNPDLKVYSTDLGMWSWFTPNPDAPLEAVWLGQLAHPELFTDIDLVEETQDYYELMYDYSLTADQAAAIIAGAQDGAQDDGQG